MSYCRMYDKRHEVYLYKSVDGYISCCGCRLGWKRCPTCGDLSPRNHDQLLQEAKFYTRTETIVHLIRHKKAGHKFPFKRVVRQLAKERKEMGDRVIGKDGDDAPTTLVGIWEEGISN